MEFKEKYYNLLKKGLYDLDIDIDNCILRYTDKTDEIYEIEMLGLGLIVYLRDEESLKLLNDPLIKISTAINYETINDIVQFISKLNNMFKSDIYKLYDMFESSNTLPNLHFLQVTSFGRPSTSLRRIIYFNEIITNNNLSNKVHELKILPEYYKNVKNGNKTFELRENNRNYKVGDCLILKEFNNNQFTGNQVIVVIKYILDQYKDIIKENYVIMSIELLF